MVIPALIAAVLGGIINLDSIAIGQSMISRPICAGPITGIFLGLFYGDIIGGLSIGLMTGALLELIWVCLLPLGAVVPPDASLAAVLASALSVVLSNEIAVSPSGALMISLTVAIPMGVVAGKANYAIRRFNICLVRLADSFARRGNARGIELVNWAGLGLIFLKAFILIFLAINLLASPLEKFICVLPIRAIRGLDLARTLLPFLGLGALLGLFVSRKLLKYFLSGFIAGVFVVLFLGIGQ